MGMIPIQGHRKWSKPVTRTRRWKVLRQYVLERDGWACVVCGSHRGRLEIDHKKPVRTHPELSFDPANCQTLCQPCHIAKTRLECGAPEITPERIAWGKAVADLAAETATQQKG